jgi:signal transduction histidine kinase
MPDFYHHIVNNLRYLMHQILEPHLDLEEYLGHITRAAKQLSPEELEARVYEVDFIENRLYLKTSTNTDLHLLQARDRTFAIRPKTITGDAIIENRVIVASRIDGYLDSRFIEGADIRAAFPIEFFDVELPEGRTKYVLVIDKKGDVPLPRDILAALKDYSVLAGLAISIKEWRDKLNRYYEESRNLVLTGKHAAAIAHDIRSLNIGVGGYLTLALRVLHAAPDYKTDSSLEKYLTLAQDNAGQMEGLLKSFSQFNRAGIVFNRNTDITVAVKEKVNSLSNRMDFERLVDFTTSIPNEPVGFAVDRDWFGTVVENLVKNSVEACNGKTAVTISLTKTDDDRIILLFKDNCGGIPSDLLPDIFTPFRTGKVTGQGLGLANAKKVVEEHGGAIKASNDDGYGAVFTIEFHTKSSM